MVPNTIHNVVRILPRYDETKEKFLSNGEEYSYVFTSAGWVCYDMNEFNDNDPEIVEIPAGNLAV